jgi:hypothetical protein
MYLQNAGSNTAGRNKYESANNMADVGDKICEYIAKIATTTQSSNATSQFDTMAAQIKALTKAINKLTPGQKNDKNKNPNAGSAGTTASQRSQMTNLRNMGAYCHSYGFHPVGVDHTSTNCSWKTSKHKDNATWTNRMSSNTYWPVANRVALEQQEHATWKGKTVPTN